MKHITKSMALAAALWAAFSFAASARQGAAICPGYDRLTVRLREIGEDRIGLGADINRRHIELWVRPDGQTWTIIIRQLDGAACIADYGVNWRPAPGIGT